MNILLIFLLSTGAGRQFYVAPGGSDSADGSALHPWATIQKAANMVAPGDTVHVAPGIYTGNITTSTAGTASAPITFISDVKWGASIRADSSHRSVWENGDANPGVAGNYINIINFDITGVALGNSPRFGIFNESSYCQFIGNNIHNVAENTTTIGYGGAGIDSGCYPPWAPTTTGNIIFGNYIHNIGGNNGTVFWIYTTCIYVNDLNCIISNNIVFDNNGFGVGTDHYSGYDTFSNNLIFNNMAGGVCLGNTSGPNTADYMTITNNIIIYNGGNQVWQGKPYPTYGIREFRTIGPNSVYSNNCVYGNLNEGSPGDYDFLTPGRTDVNSIHSGATFINWELHGTGDYHPAAGSPCINAGTSQGAPPTDYDGVPRPQGTGLDIGPYEWVPLGSRGTPSPGRSAAASQVDRSQHASMLYALLGVSGVAMVLLVALVFVLSSARPRRQKKGMESR